MSPGPAENQPEKSPLLGLLPDKFEPGGWVKEGGHQFFEGDDLFIYIDGGAEIYFEYGFRRVIVQDYANAAGRRLSLEVFEMQSPDSAYGIYTFKSGPRGEALALGDQGQRADYYLNFCKGRYLITITGLGQETISAKDLMTLARLIEVKLDARRHVPGLVSLLPQDGLNPQSLKFFMGPLALYNSYPFSRTDMFVFQTGIRGDYAAGSSLFLFEYDTEDSAKARFSEAPSRFSAEPRFKNVQQDGGRLCALDDKGKTLLAGCSGKSIALALADGREEAETLLARALARLSAEQREERCSLGETAGDS